MLLNLSKNYSTIDQMPKTAKPIYHRHNKSTLEIRKPTNQIIDRPNTSFFLTHRLNNYTHPKTVKLVAESQIDSAEHDLRKTYNVDLSNYLHKKFRNFIIRKNNILVDDSTSFNHFQNPENINNFCTKMKWMDSSQILSQSKLLPQNSKVVESAYVVNAKQRISRLIEMKRQKEDKFTRLSEGIRTKCETKEMSKRKNGWKYITKETIQDKSWDKSWKELHNNEIQRYKKKILSRTKLLFPKNQLNE